MTKYENLGYTHSRQCHGETARQAPEAVVLRSCGIPHRPIRYAEKHTLLRQGKHRAAGLAQCTMPRRHCFRKRSFQEACYEKNSRAGST